MGLLVIAMEPYDSRFVEDSPLNSDNIAVYCVLSNHILDSDCRRTWITHEQNWAHKSCSNMATKCLN